MPVHRSPPRRCAVRCVGRSSALPCWKAGRTQRMKQPDCWTPARSPSAAPTTMALSVRALAPVLAGSALPAATVAQVLRFLADNDQFFLNVAMAACKSIADGLRDIPHSTIVTAMSRNGVEFGLRVSGLGAAWFTAPAPVPDGLYFPGYGAPDANPDMGDSAIVETVGLGGMALIAGPAVVGFVGFCSAP